MMQTYLQCKFSNISDAKFSGFKVLLLTKTQPVYSRHCSIFHTLFYIPRQHKPGILDHLKIVSDFFLVLFFDYIFLFLPP